MIVHSSSSCLYHTGSAFVYYYNESALFNSSGWTQQAFLTSDRSSLYMARDLSLYDDMLAVGADNFQNDEGRKCSK